MYRSRSLHHYVYGILVYTVQLSSGSDLGMLLVQHLKDKKTPVRDELLG